MSDFIYEPMFSYGADDTQYRLLTDQYVSETTLNGKKVLVVEPEALELLAEQAFKDVVSAKEDRERIINEAQAYKEDLLPKARGEAEQMIRAAEAYKEARVREAQGKAARFLSMLKEYRVAKEVTRRRLYLETLQEVLGKVEKIIVSKEVAGKTLPFLPLGDIGTSLPLTESRKGGQQ